MSSEFLMKNYEVHFVDKDGVTQRVTFLAQNEEAARLRARTRGARKIILVKEATAPKKGRVRPLQA